MYKKVGNVIVNIDDIVMVDSVSESICVKDYMEAISNVGKFGSEKDKCYYFNVVFRDSGEHRFYKSCDKEEVEKVRQELVDILLGSNS